MRVLHVYKTYPPVLGGIEGHLELLCRRQVEQGLEVTVLVTGDGPTREAVEDGVTVVRCRRLAELRSMPLSIDLVRRLRGFRPDVTHLQSPFPLGELAHWLEGQADLRSAQFGRGYVPDPPDPEPAPVELDLQEILSAVERVLEAIPRRVLHRVVPRPLDVEGATERIVIMLESRGRIEFTDLFEEEYSVTDVLSVLVALLELARVGRLRLKQRKPFGKMGISDGTPVTAG